MMGALVLSQPTTLKPELSQFLWGELAMASPVIACHYEAGLGYLVSTQNFHDPSRCGHDLRTNNDRMTAARVHTA
jgi:hypothetical protein